MAPNQFRNAREGLVSRGKAFAESDRSRVARYRHTWLADVTARKSSIEDRSDEKNCAQHSHDDGETMQAVVGRVLTVHETEKAGRGNRADISRRTLQTRGSADLSRRRLDVNRCLGSGGR